VVGRSISPHTGGRVVTAREEILDRIRTALAGAPSPVPPVEAPRNYRAAGEHEPGSPVLLELLTDRLVDYRATVVPSTHDMLPATVAPILTGRGLRRVVAPDAVPAAWLEGVDVLRDGAATLPLADLDAADAVVTGCAVAVAETGTIVLDAGPDQGRRALTLVPDVHVVVVRADQVVQTVPEAVARLTPERPLTMISGPSATSDIELNRVEGVHGPRTLIVVLSSP
jgi:L-lactate dehydrogenase complex protein LldG